MKRAITIIICAVLIISSGFALLRIDEKAEGKAIIQDEVNYVTHVPIRINSNADLGIGINGVSAGDGSPGNPWIIENYNIDGTGYGYCIYIGNTTDYCVIKNCKLQNASGNSGTYYTNSGINLFQVQHCTVQLNIISNNDGYGIRAKYSQYNRVLDNMIFFNYESIYVYGQMNITGNIASGLELHFASQTRIADNQLNNGTGIHIWASDRLTIINNTIHNSSGIVITYDPIQPDVVGHNSTISNNYLSDTTEGILIHFPVKNVRIENNTIANGTQGLQCSMIDGKVVNNIINNITWGIYFVWPTNNSLINGNTFTSCYEASILEGNNNTFSSNFIRFSGIGLEVRGTGNNTIINNILWNNSLGMSLVVTNNNKIYNNDFISNSMWQASDNGNNQWYANYPGGGNYWSDYDGIDLFSGINQNVAGSDGWGDSPYNKINLCSNVDQYPVMLPSVDLEPPVSIVVPLRRWYNSSTTIEVNATDHGGNNVKNVTLLYRIKINEWSGPFGNWTAYGTKTISPWSWNFNFPGGDGYYEFTSVAVDTVNISEDDAWIAWADTGCYYDGTEPSIILISPLNNSSIQPGNSIIYQIEDNNLNYINSSFDGNTTQTNLGESYNSMTTYNMSIITSGIGDGKRTLIVSTSDRANNSASSVFTIFIDGSAPHVVNTSPKNNSINVPTDGYVCLTFNEKMNKTSVENAIIISPTPVIEKYSWSTNGTSVNITFLDDLLQNTRYSVNIYTNAKDLAGNRLDRTYITYFTTIIDTDGDGIPNNDDPDDDNDGVQDVDDAFPLDPNESLDTDNDGIGNNADLDDDGDGILDIDDLFPLDDTETVDFDGDGIGDNADLDDDGDGYLDTWELFLGTDPLNPNNEPKDTDGDGIPNGDATNSQSWMDTDDDGDGVLDVDDFAPLDPNVTEDPNAQTFNGQYWWIILILIIVPIVWVAAYLMRKKQPPKMPKEPENGEIPEGPPETG